MNATGVYYDSATAYTVTYLNVRITVSECPARCGDQDALRRQRPLCQTHPACP